MSTPLQLLLCDDDLQFHLTLKTLLRGKHQLRSAHNSAEAKAILKSFRPDFVLLDIEMRTPLEGLEFLKEIQSLDPDQGVIMLSGQTNFDMVREAMLLGAIDYIPKASHADDIFIALERARNHRSLQKKSIQNDCESDRNQRNYQLIGESPELKQLKQMIERVRKSRANVVITGETGTGKEVVARNLRGLRDDGSLAPFVAIDSSTIQSSTAESTLFGHEKGAFTGAEKANRGLFEEADKGIVYFDEIANMPLDIQSKLLRAIQEKEVTRLGSAKTIPLDFRVICATNQPLEKLVSEGKFKDDLFQRLNVIPLEIPPLRKRKSDIPLLIAHFAKLNATQAEPLNFSESAMEQLTHYSWPGNIRELANVIAYLNVMTDETTIEVDHLPKKISDTQSWSPEQAEVLKVVQAQNSGQSFYQRVAEFEKTILASEFQRSDGNISKLASGLGMDRSHLYTKLKEYSLYAPAGGDRSSRSKNDP